MDKTELSKIMPKCWVCGVLVIPKEVKYCPLRCEECKKEVKKFSFTRSEYCPDELWKNPAKERDELFNRAL